MLDLGRAPYLYGICREPPVPIVRGHFQICHANFLIVVVFAYFLAENGLTEAREALKNNSRGRRIQSDRLWARGEPPGPDSWPKV